MLIKADKVIWKIGLVSVDERIVKRIHRIISGSWWYHKGTYVLRWLIVGFSENTTVGSHIFFLSKRILHVSLINQIFWRVAWLYFWHSQCLSSLIALTLKILTGITLNILVGGDSLFSFSQILFQGESIVFDDLFQRVFWINSISVSFFGAFVSKDRNNFVPLNWKPELCKVGFVLVFILECVVSVSLMFPVHRKFTFLVLTV